MPRFPAFASVWSWKTAGGVGMDPVCQCLLRALQVWQQASQRRGVPFPYSCPTPGSTRTRRMRKVLTEPCHPGLNFNPDVTADTAPQG